MADHKSFLSEVDEEKVAALLEEVANNSAQFAETVSRVVASYSRDLDELMADIYTAVTQEDAITTDGIERYYAELTSMLYFMGDKLERLNVESDMAKAAAKDVYNKAYLAACSEKDEKGKSIRTVAENTSVAETSTQYNSVVSQVYEHAYRAVKSKVDAASEMVSTLKHILRKRVSDEYLNNQLASMKMVQGESTFD